MSVTFSVEYRASDVLGYELCDGFGGKSVQRYATYGSAAEALTVFNMVGDPLPGCQDPELAAGYGASIEAVYVVDNPWLNVSNTNARALLTQLGIVTDELYGSADPADLRGRILLAQALLPIDPGEPLRPMPDTDGRWVHGGRRPAYIQEKLAALVKVVDAAAALGRQVAWC